jgi:cell division FtsZ-interacting protein ZapD
MKDNTYKKYCLIVDEWFVNGRNGTKAYQKFTTASSHENAANRFTEIMRLSEIIEYVETKNIKKANDLDITLDKQLQRLNDIIDDKETRPVDKINAIKEQSKLLALYEEHNRQKGVLSINEKVTINFKNKK